MKRELREAVIVFAFFLWPFAVAIPLALLVVWGLTR